MTRRTRITAAAGLFAVLVAAGPRCVSAQTSVTPDAPPPPTQLQSGATPSASVPPQSGATSFGTSELRSGMTVGQVNPLATATPVPLSGFSLGGASTVPGADSASGSSNGSNSTNATSGKGFAR